MREAPDPSLGPADLASLVALLSTCWFAAGLSPEAQLSLARLARRYQAPAGTTLLAEGEAVRELGIVLRGRVSVRTLVPERGLVTILTVEPGDIFAKSALVPPYRSTATVVAIQDVDVIALDAARLRAALAADCVLSAALYPRLVEVISRRLDATRLQLLDLFAGEPRGT
jgi:CRP-like cAMP-binding protein